MSAFDERFADRAREVFDAYAEPVDEPTWERVQTALAETRPPARDRAPIAGAWTRRSRALVALATLVLVSSVGTWVMLQADGESPEAASVAVRMDGPPDLPTVPVPKRADAASALAADAPEARVPERRAPSSPARSADALSPARQAGSSMPAAARLGARPTPPPPARPPDLAETQDVAPSQSPETPPSTTPLEVTPASPIASTQPAVTRRPDRVDETFPSDVGPEALGPESNGMGIDLVLATNAAFSGRQLAEGAGLTAGVSREWRLGSGLAISTGALAAYSRLTATSDGSVSEALASFESDPLQSVEVPTQTTLSTLALEVPLDLLVDLADAGPGRLRAGVGLTTSLYLAQTFDDQGERYTVSPRTDVSGEAALDFTSTAYRSTETATPLSHLDLGRQANLSLGYTLDRGRTPLSVDAYTRLPLGGVTSRDLPLTVVGVRLRVGL